MMNCKQCVKGAAGDSRPLNKYDLFAQPAENTNAINMAQLKEYQHFSGSNLASVDCVSTNQLIIAFMHPFV